MKILLFALLVALSPGALAQAVTDEPVKKPVTKKVVPKKTGAAKKPAPKKAEAPKKAAETRVYQNDPNAPKLYDKQGNVIPTNPNAYDVSSAIGKK
ncbi:MAG: hypothetical protein ABI789_00900 [Usitatibacter sp.]